MIKVITLGLASSFLLFGLTACDPEVGSKEWCLAMKEKPAADWSTNEAADFTKNCVLASD